MRKYVESRVSKRAKRGSVLITVLAMTAVLGILGAGLLSTVLWSQKSALILADRQQAYFAARSGISAMAAYMKTCGQAQLDALTQVAPDGSPYKYRGNLDGSEYEVTVEKTTDGYRIGSLGSFQSQTSQIYARLTLTNTFDAGIFSNVLYIPNTLGTSVINNCLEKNVSTVTGPVQINMSKTQLDDPRSLTGWASLSGNISLGAWPAASGAPYFLSLTDHLGVRGSAAVLTTINGTARSGIYLDTSKDFRSVLFPSAWSKLIIDATASDIDLVFTGSGANLSSLFTGKEWVILGEKRVVFHFEISNPVIALTDNGGNSSFSLHREGSSDTTNTFLVARDNMTFEMQNGGRMDAFLFAPNGCVSLNYENAKKQEAVINGGVVADSIQMTANGDKNKPTYRLNFVPPDAGSLSDIAVGKTWNIFYSNQLP